jgi:RHS repeat-associated protein
VTTNANNFTSYNRDSETGFDYAMARYYGDRHGRFMSPDPGHVGASIGDPQSWNAYAYVGNDPINWVDPDGLFQRGLPNCPKDDPSNQRDQPCRAWGGGSPAGPCNDAENPMNCGPSGSGQKGDISGTYPPGPVFVPPKKKFPGIRSPGESFSQCMATNANTYSLGGALDLAIGSYTGTDSTLFSNRIAGTVTGNAVNTLLFGNNVDLAATTYTSGGAYVVAKGMGQTLTHSRRPADIMSLNLNGTAGRSPRVFETSTTSAKTAVGKVGNALSFGLTFVERATIDVAFTAGEAISCSIPR